MANKPGKKKRLVLGYLNPKVRLAADKHCFILEGRVRQTDTKEIWAGRYYYSTLVDALLGYAKHKMRKAKVQNEGYVPDKSMLALLDAVKHLNENIQEIGTRLEKEWKDRCVEMSQMVQEIEKGKKT